MEIKNNLLELLNSVGDQCTLVAVSKTKPVEDILEAYETGHRDFGENKVQELTAKQEKLPEDIKWHMIGHLQRNKVKYLAPFVHLIHGVDRLKLLKEINKQGEKIDRVLDCLLQIHIAKEDSKFGFDEDEVMEMLKSPEFDALTHIRVKGLMGMATFTDNTDQVRKEFKGLKSLFDDIKANINKDKVEMEILSMGMSGDYEIALEEGSNMIRVGSAIFGARD